MAQRTHGHGKAKPLTRSDGLLNVAHALACHALIIAYCVFVHRLFTEAAAGAVSQASAVIAAALTPLVFVIHQRVMSEWMHESAHHNFYPGRRRNDQLTLALIGPFFLEHIAPHRRTHLRHHVAPRFFVPEDPDTALLVVRTKGEFLRGFLSDLFGLTAYRAIRRALKGGEPAAVTPPPSEGRYTPLVIAGHLAFAALLYFTAPQYLWAQPLYLVTYLTLYPAVNRVRVYCQHIALDTRDDERDRVIVAGSRISRTMRTSGFDRLFFNSRVMLFHHEHHDHPGVAYRSLWRMTEPSFDINTYYGGSRLLLLARIYRALPETVTGVAAGLSPPVESRSKTRPSSHEARAMNSTTW